MIARWSADAAGFQWFLLLHLASNLYARSFEPHTHTHAVHILTSRGTNNVFRLREHARATAHYTDTNRVPDLS